MQRQPLQLCMPPILLHEEGIRPDRPHAADQCVKQASQL